MVFREFIQRFQFFLTLYIKLLLCLVGKWSLTLLQPHGLQPTRLLCSWDFPGKNTRVGGHFFLQDTSSTQGSNPRLLHWQVGALTIDPPGNPYIYKVRPNKWHDVSRVADPGSRRAGLTFLGTESSHGEPLHRHPKFYPIAHPRLQVVQRLRDDNVEHSMGAAAFFIHVGCSYRPRLVSLRHQWLNVLEAGTRKTLWAKNLSEQRPAHPRMYSLWCIPSPPLQGTLPPLFHRARLKLPLPPRFLVDAMFHPFLPNCNCLLSLLSTYFSLCKFLRRKELTFTVLRYSIAMMTLFYSLLHSSLPYD